MVFKFQVTVFVLLSLGICALADLNTEFCGYPMGCDDGRCYKRVNGHHCFTVHLDDPETAEPETCNNWAMCGCDSKCTTMPWREGNTAVILLPYVKCSKPFLA